MLVQLLQDAPKEISEAGARLRCNPLYYLDVALDRPCGVDLHWVYVPEPRFPFYRVGCYSNFSSAMAPPGKAGLYVELASREAPDLDHLLPVVASGLCEMGIIDHPSEIRFADVMCIDHAYVIYDHAYEEALSVLTPFLQEHNILSCGRYGGWNYSSMEDALLYGRGAAQQARERIG